MLYGTLLAFMAWRGGRLGGLGFYLVFALAITASVQLVGVYLMFANLILPALAVGALAYAAGLAASALLDWPARPATVIALAVFALLAGTLLRVAASGGQR